MTNNKHIEAFIKEREETFENDPDLGRAFLMIARGLAQLHGTDENDEKTPILHKEAIKAFLRESILAGVVLGLELAEGCVPEEKGTINDELGKYAAFALTLDGGEAYENRKRALHDFRAETLNRIAALSEEIKGESV